MERKQTARILKDLEKKMVFIVGPRQVGKTWLAKEIAARFSNPIYLNYDRAEDREIIRQESWPRRTDLLIFDELHKMKQWKNYLKGIYDTKEPNLKILVTGSARLNTFRQSGDSLAGRFFAHRLLPFSLAELKGAGPDYGLERLLERGGFPEPFLANTDEDADRWRRQYIDGLVRTDILDFEMIHNFRAIQLVFDLLRSKVGSPVSYTSIAEDAQVSPATAKKYVEIFEALFIVFRVFPHSRSIARSVLKEPKIYFFDNGLVAGDDGAKFENLAASSLLKNVWAKTDQSGREHELRYLRTKNGQEVDFALTEDGRIGRIIEVKLSDAVLSKNLLYFSGKYSLPGTQMVKELKREKSVAGLDIVRAEKFLGDLYL